MVAIYGNKVAQIGVVGHIIVITLSIVINLPLYVSGVAYNNVLLRTFILNADSTFFPEVDGPKASRSSGNEMMLMRILHFGRELKSMNSVLTETNGTSESNDQMLEV